MRNSLAQPVWPGRLKEKKGTMASRMTWACQKMSIGMVLPGGDTTRSSIYDAMQTKIDSGTDHDQSMRNQSD
jgi:hypothetical protein